MTTPSDHIARLAELLDRAERERREVDLLTLAHPDLSVDDAYLAQEALIARRVGRGDRVVGVKAGLTSRAKQEAMGVREPIAGWVCESMVREDGAAIAAGVLIHPRVEPEIALVLGADLAGPGVTRDQARAAVAAVLPALEVIDSRYRDFRFTLADVVADNASAARVVLGAQQTRPLALDLRLIGMAFYQGGELLETGAGAAVLGDPCNVLAWLANQLAARGRSLQAGQIVMPGALCNAHLMTAGSQFTAEFDRLGSVTLSCV